jgi:hypothetical protein
MVWITTIDFPDECRGVIMRKEKTEQPCAMAAGGSAMEMNEYTLEKLVQEKLNEARAATARRALVPGSRSPRGALRARLGAALIALGEWLSGTPGPQRPRVTQSASRG